MEGVMFLVQCVINYIYIHFLSTMIGDIKLVILIRGTTLTLTYTLLYYILVEVRAS
jgi:hypothetical protein